MHFLINKLRIMKRLYLFTLFLVFTTGLTIAQTNKLPDLKKDFQPQGEGIWILKSEQGEMVSSNSAEEFSFYSARVYKWLNVWRNNPEVLLYADDWFHEGPNTFPDQALRNLGLSYIAVYGDWGEFYNLLDSESWELVIFANDNFSAEDSIYTALEEYVNEGGTLIFQSWDLINHQSHSIWEALGGVYNGHSNQKMNILRTDNEHEFFNDINQIEDFTQFSGGEPQEVSEIYSGLVEGFEPIATFSENPAITDSLALIRGNEGKTVFKTFVDSHLRDDQNENGKFDGIELWENLIYNILDTEFEANFWVRVENAPYLNHAGTAQAYMENDTGRLFVFGGQGNNTFAGAYNVNTNQWETNLENLPAPRLASASARINDNIYILGGMNAELNPVNTNFIYNITDNTYSTGALLPIEVSWGKAIAYNDSLIYHVGGNETQAISSVFFYNINNDTWTEATSLPSARIGGALAVMGDSLIYIGGATTTTTQGQTFIGVIHPTQKDSITWTTATPFPAGTRFRWDAQIWQDGIIVSGGSQNIGFVGTTDAWHYNPHTDTWTQLPNKKRHVCFHFTGSFQFPDGRWEYVVSSGYNGTIEFQTDYTEKYTDRYGTLFISEPYELTANINAELDAELNWEFKYSYSYFNIYRSEDGTDFFIIDISEYPEYIDNTVNPGMTYYYYVTKVNPFGESDASNIAEISIPTETGLITNNNAIQLQCFPVPFDENIKINFSVGENDQKHKNKTNIKIYDLFGRLIAEPVNDILDQGKYEIVYDASSIKAGTYILKYSSGGQLFIQKITKIN